MDLTPGPARSGRRNPARFACSIPIFILVLLLCIPVSAQSGFITASISTEPGPVILNASGYEKQGQAFQAARNWTGVLATTDEGLALFPEDAELMCLKGYALRKTGQYQESVDIISRAIPLDPKPIRYANRAYGLLALGRYQDALNDTNSAVAINATFPTAYDARSLALLGLGNLTGAGQAIDTAISLDPANAHSWQVKGDVLSRSGNCSGAIQAYQRSIAINPDYDLPWPGMTNATVELNQTEQRCAAAATQAIPVTTKAGLPVVVAMVAVGIGAMWVRKKG
jgi:tetratricopeptide (TPR) repeat protein